MKDFNWPTDDDTDYRKYQFVFKTEVKEHQLYKIEKNDKEYKLILINGDEKDEK